MASPSVTYTFSNSTTADATQVNQNFTDLINSLTDGTKDLSISALTCAGNATFNGNTTIGNASSDTLTITASLASTIPVGTTFSYDIGSTTIGLRDVYFGSADSAAKTTKIRAGTVSSSNTLTLPIISGTVALYSNPVITIKSSGSGTHTLQSNVKWVRLRLIGGGGGGGGSGTTNGTAGTAGGDTLWKVAGGAAFLTAGGGSAGARGSTAPGAAGGTPTTGAGATIIISMNGNDGDGGISESINTVSIAGGGGGAGPWGGAGIPAINTGGNSVANSGAGGPGGGMSGVVNGITGGGGGAGAYIEAIITSPSASYDYAVGAAGTGQAAGTSGAAGGNGGSGVIIIEEYFG